MGRNRGWLVRARGGAVLALAMALAGGGTPAGAAQKATPGGLAVSLATDRATYQVGDPIIMSLEVVNRTGEELTLEFNDAQRYDFIVRDAADKEVWRWARERLFAQMLGSETLGPSRPRLAYRAQFKGSLAPGSYRIEGRVTARNHPLSATITVHVR